MGVVFANRSLNGSHIRYTIFNNSYTISFNSWKHSNCQDKDLIVLSITTLKVIVENSIKYFYRIAKDIKTKHIEFNNHNYVEFKRCIYSFNNTFMFKYFEYDLAYSSIEKLQT